MTDSPLSVMVQSSTVEELAAMFILCLIVTVSIPVKEWIGFSCKFFFAVPCMLTFAELVSRFYILLGG
jgi:hypothetical protein